MMEVNNLPGIISGESEINATNYNELVSFLNYCSKKYYLENQQVITDHYYDLLFELLKDYEVKNGINNPNSPTNKVGVKPVEDGAYWRSRHYSKMYSLANIFNREGLEKWLANIRNDLTKYVYDELEVCIEPKYDGLSLNLIYVKGGLTFAITRGDGWGGESVTDNASRIPNIPTKIDVDYCKLEIRGEVVLERKYLDTVNEYRKKKGLPVYTNCRNAASGILRHQYQDGKDENMSKYLKFYPWGVGIATNSLDEEISLGDKHDVVLKYIKSLGFVTNKLEAALGHNVRKLKDIDSIEKLYSDYIKYRDNSSYDMDGMVIKLNDVSTYKVLGHTSHHPRFMIAYKFPQQEKTAKLTDVIIQVGRTGKLTPVAILDTIEIGGVNISRVTLHNFKEIERLNVGINDYVNVIRSGDVIPKITGVCKELRTKENKVRVIPKPNNCPVCNSVLEDDGVNLYCRNKECAAKVIYSISYYASRNCMDIKGLGAEVIVKLYKRGVLKSIKDIYLLKPDSFKGINGFGDKKIESLLKAIEESKTKPMYRFIAGLGITGIGREAAEVLVSEYPGTTWLDKTVEDYMSIRGFGRIASISLAEYVTANKKELLNLIDMLKLT